MTHTKKPHNAQKKHKENKHTHKKEASSHNAHHTKNNLLNITKTKVPKYISHTSLQNQMHILKQLHAIIN